MRIYGVIDIKGSQVVHAVAGRRDQYRPIRSSLVDSARPHAVADAFLRRCGIQHAYVADLDAIAGSVPDLASIAAIARAGLHLVLDAGIATVDHASQLFDQLAPDVQLAGLVVPLESADETAHWTGLVERIGVRRAVFSLDLQAGRPLTNCAQLARLAPAAIADLAWSAGFRRLIVLDLHHVGTGGGPGTLDLCRQLAGQHDWEELITGGGVRDARDLSSLQDAGCHAALVASMLHRGGDVSWDAHER